MSTTTTETTTTDGIEIAYVEGENALYERFRGQTSAQPCFVELNCETGELSAEINPEVGNAVPFRVWHRRALRWSIPALRTDVANALLDEIRPEAARIVAGYEVEWDGNNHVGSYSADAEEAIEAVSSLCERTWDSDDIIEAWDAADWFGGVGSNDAQRRSLGITAATTDDELTAIVERERAEAAPREIEGIDRHLSRLRDEARAEAEESDAE